MTDTITTDDARELALTYHWFMRDLDAQNDCGITIYGDWLLSMQERMGVELIDPISLKIIMRGAQERYDADMGDDAHTKSARLKVKRNPDGGTYLARA